MVYVYRVLDSVFQHYRNDDLKLSEFESQLSRLTLELFGVEPDDLDYDFQADFQKGFSPFQSLIEFMKTEITKC